MKKAVVFDMDGVIFDSEKMYRRFWRRAAEDNQLPLEGFDKVCEQFAGGTKAHNGKVFYDHFGIDGYVEFREYMYRMLDLYLEDHMYELKEGAVELFEYLKENGYKIALATSTKKIRAERNLIRADLLKYFDVTIYGDTIGEGKGKPEPYIYLKACEELSVDPKDAIGVEDSINGVISSGRAGLYTVMAVDLIKPNEKTRDYADFTCDSLLELMNHLKENGELL